MTVAPRALDRIQRWMQSVVTHPHGVRAGVESAAARAEIDVSPEEIETIVTRSRSLDAASRLAIYGNAYYARLHECLRDEFASVAHAVGEDVFGGFVFDYLQSHPSRSYTLGMLGANFPRYLAESRPPRDVPDEPDWADFLIDLATVERAYGDVFDGPGVEDEPLLQLDDLLAIAPDSWPLVRLECVPCLRLLPLRFPVHEYASQVRREEEPTIPEPRPTWLTITRREFVVRREEQSPTQFALLSALQSGRPLAAAIEQAVADTGVGIDELAPQLQGWFRDWTRAGYFHRAAIDVPAAD